MSGDVYWGRKSGYSIMGITKQIYCHKGHLLKDANVVFNCEGFRECRTCKQTRKYKVRREARCVESFFKRMGISNAKLLNPR